MDSNSEPAEGVTSCAREDIAFLVGSDARIEIFRTLRSGSHRPIELAERCSCARETAQRTVSAFVDRGWVEKVSTAEGYRLTSAGQLVAKGYGRFQARVVMSERLSDLLGNLPGADALSALDFETLQGLTHARATTGNPHAPLDRFLAVVGEEPVEEWRGITPIVSRVFNQAAAEVIGPDTRAELVVDEGVLATSREEYPESLDRAEQIDGFSLYVSPEPLEFGLMVVDGHAYLGAYDERDNLVASADGTDDAFVDWAERTYERIRDRAAEWEG